METVILKPFIHRGAEQIAIVFTHNKKINDVVKKIKGVKWTETHKCWYVPLTKEDCQRIIGVLKELAKPDLSELRVWLEKRNKILIMKNSSGQGQSFTTKALTTYALSDENL